jgi:2-hydroxychromene-2-carboxylate isomerase
MSRTLTVYFSLLSPWAYIGHAELRKIIARHRLRPIWRPVALAQVFPESGGLPLAKRHPFRQRYRMLELQRWRDRRGLNFHLHPQFWPFDPAPADRIACALAEAGANPEPFIASAFAGIFERQRNLADPQDLAATLADCGLGPEWLAHGASGAAEIAYQRHLALALDEGVFGSPSYVLDGEIFWGQDRLELLDDALTSRRKSFSADA